MVVRVISGFQTGVDQGGIRAAKALGIPTGGYMPRGFLTEAGPRPEFAEMYGAVELPTVDYPARTRRNVLEASATVWFGDLGSPGSLNTHNAALALGRSVLDVVEGVKPSDVAAWLRSNGFGSLNVAGSRESRAPGIGERVEQFMLATLRRLAQG